MVGRWWVIIDVLHEAWAGEQHRIAPRFWGEPSIFTARNMLADREITRKIAQVRGRKRLEQ
jgi:hypothetical protein